MESNQPLTAKEKASQLVDNIYNKYYMDDGISYITACELAIMCVDEIQKAGQQPIVNEYFDDIYWNEVKTEINKL